MSRLANALPLLVAGAFMVPFAFNAEEVQQMVRPDPGPLVFNIGLVPLAQNRIPVPTPRPRKQRSKNPCEIVTDSSLTTYVHELAHCNGWDHPPHATSDTWVPPEFLHAYYGPITVTITGNGNPGIIRDYAQADAKIVVSQKSAEALCSERGTAAKPGYYKNVLGCAPVWPAYWIKRK